MKNTIYSSSAFLCLLLASDVAWSCGERCRPNRTVAREIIPVIAAGSPTVGDLPECETRPSIAPPATRVVSDQLDEESRRIAEYPWSRVRGAPDCGAPGARDPKFEVLEVNPGYFILRQNKCTNFEAPFIYIMLGPDGAFMHDTGASGPGVNQELLRIVNGIVGDRPLTVGHGHGHGDHTAGDSIFESRPNTRVIGTGAQAVSRAYGIDPWPTGTGQINLGGGRIIDVVPIPGHADDSVAFYDRHSRDMLTGDSLYPGNIFNGGDETFRASNRRLWEFAQRNGVRNVLGSHIEMTGRPGVNYPYPGRDHSASEQSLVLRSRHICQLAHADRTAANWPAGLPADCTPPYTPQEVEGIRQAEEAAGRGWQQQGDETVFPDFLVP